MKFIANEPLPKKNLGSSLQSVLLVCDNIRSSDKDFLNFTGGQMGFGLFYIFEFCQSGPSPIVRCPRRAAFTVKRAIPKKKKK